MKVLFIGLASAILSMACAEKQAMPSSNVATIPEGGTAKVADIGVIVTLDDSRPLADIVRDMERSGFTKENAMDRVGIVTGRVASKDVMTALESIRGVAAVELDLPVGIAAAPARATP
jgi:hypothetical protein